MKCLLPACLALLLTQAVPQVPWGQRAPLTPVSSAAPAALPPLVPCRTLREVSGHIGAICSLAYSPDGKYIATGGIDGLVVMRRADTGQILHTFFYSPRPDDFVGGYGVQALFTPDGKYVVASERFKTPRQWNVATGIEKPLPLEETPLPIDAFTSEESRDGFATVGQRIAFSPDGTLAATLKFPQLRIFDAHMHKQRTFILLQGRRSDTSVLTFSPDSRILAVDQSDVKPFDNNPTSDILLFDSHTGQQKKAFPQAVGSAILAVFSPDGKWLASSSGNEKIYLWDVETGTLKHTLIAGAGRVCALAISPDSKTLVTSNDSDLTLLWDAANGQKLRTLLKDFQARSDSLPRDILALNFAPDGKTLAMGGNSGVPLLWNTITWQSESVTPQGGSSVITTAAVVYSPDNHTFVTGLNNGNVEVWDSRQGRAGRAFKAHESGVVFAAYGRDGKTLTTAGEDNLVKTWNVSTAQEISATRKLPAINAYDVAFSKDGTRMAGWAGQTAVELWDTTTAQRLQNFTIDSDARRMAISPNNKLAAVETIDGGITIWDGETGKSLFTFGKYRRGINPPLRISMTMPMTFSADSALLACHILRQFTHQQIVGQELKEVKDYEHVIHLQNVTNADKAIEWPVERMGGNTANHRLLVFAPNGRFLAMEGAHLNTIGLLDTKTGKYRLLEGHKFRIYGLAFSPDSKRLVSTDRSGAIRIWTLH